jgi:hypothetical protein
LKIEWVPELPGPFYKGIAMNSRMIIAIVLIIVGVIGLAYQGFTYTTRERVVDAGPITIDVDKKRTVPIAPIVGGAALIAGIALMLVGRRSAA